MGGRLSMIKKPRTKNIDIDSPLLYKFRTNCIIDFNYFAYEKNFFKFGFDRTTETE